MTRRDLAWRLAGVAVAACAGGTSLVHRHILAAAANRPASAIEMGVGLASFCLASLGVLLILNGVRIRDEWRAGCVRASALEAEKPEENEPWASARRSTEPMPIDPIGFGSGRIAMAYWLAQRTLAHPALSPRRGTPKAAPREKTDINKDIFRDRTRPALRHPDLPPPRRRRNGGSL